MTALTKENIHILNNEHTQSADITENSAESSKKQPANTETPWDKELFIETINIVHHFTICNHKTLNTEKALTFIEEIYKYSLKNGKLDPQFANWLLNKGLKK